ncbi:MAG: protein-glutamate O-methyltransferase CheR [Alphaproteobacteria bacterium]
MNIASNLALNANVKPVEATAKPTLGTMMFNDFANLIYELSGIRFQENKSYFLASKLYNRCQALGLGSFEEYLTYLKGSSARMEYGHLVDEITINETFFYRHQPQLEAFQHEILTPLNFIRKSQRSQKLRIWSCAASTGDEAYTLALLIKSMGLGLDPQIEIIGTDICHDALVKARAGAYKKYAIRNVPADQLAKYFRHDIATDTYYLNDEIKNMVKFQECNLMDSTRVSALGKFDIAVCRNVLIYFDEPSKEKAILNIYNNLKEDGFLMLGHSENIYAQRHLFKQDKGRQAAIAYTKMPVGTPKSAV